MAHNPAKGIDLAHEISLGKASHRRIAAQASDRIKALCYKQCGETFTGSCAGCLYAGMATSDNDYVIISHIIFPDRISRTVCPAGLLS